MKRFLLSSEGGMRVPFIVHYPAKLPKGKRTDAFAYVSDVTPTLTGARRRTGMKTRR